jgi:hypothetical protein
MKAIKENPENIGIHLTEKAELDEEESFQSTGMVRETGVT